jgi:hypothetical protein
MYNKINILFNYFVIMYFKHTHMKNLLILLLLLPLFSRAQFTFDQGFGLGNSGIDGFTSIVVDSTGNKYCAGSFEDSIDADPGSGVSILYGNSSETDAFVAKYGPAGNLIWAKALGGNGADEVTSMELDHDGNVYIAGYFESTADFGGGTLTSIGPYDLFVAKFDATGQHIWSKRYGGIDESTQIFFSVDDTGNNIAICGYFSDTLDLGTGLLHANGSTSPFVALLNSSGDALWAHTFGGPSTDRATAIYLSNSGNVYLSGVTSGINVDVDPGSGTYYISSFGSSDIYLIRYDITGAFHSAFSLEGEGGDIIFAIDITDNNELYLTGYTNSDSIDVDPDSANAVFLYGDTTISFVQDILLTKYDSSYNYLWSLRMGKRASDSGRKIKVDNQGNVLLAGSIADSNIDFDPGPATFYLSGDTNNLTNNSSFLAQYDQNGAFVGAFTFEDSLTIGSIFLKDDGRVWVCGNFRSPSIDLDPGIGNTNTLNGGLTDAFLAAYLYQFNSSVAEYPSQRINFFPNPCADILKTDLIYKNQIVKIYNSLGSIVRQTKLTINGTIDMKDLKSGVYTIAIYDDSVMSTFKIIKN